VAEDAVQSATVTAWRNLRALRDADRFEAWLHRLVVHACYDEARRGVCEVVLIRPVPPWFGSGERHRIYAVPTAGDTILVITWGVNWSNGMEEHLRRGECGN
jgi:hypothetical protein